MILRRRELLIAFAIVYGFFTVLFFMIRKQETFTHHCGGLRSQCLSFCCEDPIVCQDAIIRDSFNKTLEKKMYSEARQFDYNILHGKPTCSSLQPIDDHQWGISSVNFANDSNLHWLNQIHFLFKLGKVFQLGENNVRRLHYDEYCFTEKTEGDQVTWKALSCRRHTVLLIIVQFSSNHFFLNQFFTTFSI
jgi:hypothetical protein